MVSRLIIVGAVRYWTDNGIKCFTCLPFAVWVFSSRMVKINLVTQLLMGKKVQLFIGVLCL